MRVLMTTDTIGGVRTFTKELVRQLLAGGQLPVEDGLRERAGNDLIFRFAARLDSWQPGIHRHVATVSGSSLSCVTR